MASSAMKPAKELALAAGAGDLDTMRATLSAFPDAAKDWQPIMDACHMGQPEAVELLLERGADPNVVSKSANRYRPLQDARMLQLRDLDWRWRLTTTSPRCLCRSPVSFDLR
ncbi:MAG: hypothetical protein EOO77_28665 [Oxalobacteraceae bacterium]|nr:MAG: hypothetical protein EOO77_28665 [Oxalobacteraceae bacterium]